MESSAARILVVANKTAATPALLDAVRERAARGPCEFTLLVPNATHGLHKVVDPGDQSQGEDGDTVELAVPLQEEAEGAPAQIQQLLDATSRDTVRSRSFTGKPARMLRNRWSEAWENPENPDPLPMPLQYMVSGDCVARRRRYAGCFCCWFCWLPPSWRRWPF